MDGQRRSCCSRVISAMGRRARSLLVPCRRLPVLLLLACAVPAQARPTTSPPLPPWPLLLSPVPAPPPSSPHATSGFAAQTSISIAHDALAEVGLTDRLRAIATAFISWAEQAARAGGVAPAAAHDAPSITFTERARLTVIATHVMLPPHSQQTSQLLHSSHGREALRTALQYAVQELLCDLTMECSTVLAATNGTRGAPGTLGAAPPALEVSVTVVRKRTAHAAEADTGLTDAQLRSTLGLSSAEAIVASMGTLVVDAPTAAAVATAAAEAATTHSLSYEIGGVLEALSAEVTLAFSLPAASSESGGAMTMDGRAVAQALADLDALARRLSPALDGPAESIIDASAVITPPTPPIPAPALPPPLKPPGNSMGAPSGPARPLPTDGEADEHWQAIATTAITVAIVVSVLLVLALIVIWSYVWRHAGRPPHSQDQRACSRTAFGQGVGARRAGGEEHGDGIRAPTSDSLLLLQSTRGRSHYSSHMTPAGSKQQAMKARARQQYAAHADIDPRLRTGSASGRAARARQPPVLKIQTSPLAPLDEHSPTKWDEAPRTHVRSALGRMEGAAAPSKEDHATGDEEREERAQGLSLDPQNGGARGSVSSPPSIRRWTACRDPQTGQWSPLVPALPGVSHVHATGGLSGTQRSAAGLQHASSPARMLCANGAGRLGSRASPVRTSEETKGRHRCDLVSATRCDLGAAIPNDYCPVYGRNVPSTPPSSCPSTSNTSSAASTPSSVSARASLATEGAPGSSSTGGDAHCEMVELARSAPPQAALATAPSANSAAPFAWPFGLPPSMASQTLSCQQPHAQNGHASGADGKVVDGRPSLKCSEMPSSSYSHGSSPLRRKESFMRSTDGSRSSPSKSWPLKRKDSFLRSPNASPNAGPQPWPIPPMPPPLRAVRMLPEAITSDMPPTNSAPSPPPCSATLHRDKFDTAVGSAPQADLESRGTCNALPDAPPLRVQQYEAVPAPEDGPVGAPDHICALQYRPAAMLPASHYAMPPMADPPPPPVAAPPCEGDAVVPAIPPPPPPRSMPSARERARAACNPDVRMHTCSSAAPSQARACHGAHYSTAMRDPGIHHPHHAVSTSVDTSNLSSAACAASMAASIPGTSPGTGAGKGRGVPAIDYLPQPSPYGVGIPRIPEAKEDHPKNHPRASLPPPPPPPPRRRSPPAALVPAATHAAPPAARVPVQRAYQQREAAPCACALAALNQSPGSPQEPTDAQVATGRGQSALEPPAGLASIAYALPGSLPALPSLSEHSLETNEEPDK